MAIDSTRVPRSGWKVGGALLAAAAGWTTYESLRPLAGDAAGRDVNLGEPVELRRRDRDLCPGGSTVRRQHRHTVSRCRRSARISAAASRSATLRAGSSARATGRSTTSAASGSKAPRRGAWTATDLTLDGDRRARRRHVEGDHRPRPRRQAVPHARQGPVLHPEGLSRCPANARPRRRSSRPRSSAASTATSSWGSCSWSCSSPASSSTGCASRGCAPTRRGAADSYRDDRHPAVRHQLLVVPRQGRGRRERAGAERQGVPEEHHRRRRSAT